MGSIIFSFRKAFTLVELMIVIAIIGVLATALYPQVGKYISRSRDAGRITALADIGTALDASRFDYDGNYPSHTGGCVPMATLVTKRYISSGITSPSGTGYNEGCGNNGQYAYGNLGIGNILMATMENPQGGNYSGSTDGFTGTITQSGILSAFNTKKGVGKFYIRPTNYILNNAIFLVGTLTGSCGAVANTCVVGTATGYTAAACGSPETWICLGSTGSLNANCNTTRSCSTVGACGTANGFPGLTYPVGGFCSDVAMSVTPNDTVGTDGTFNWTCNGIGGAGAVACSAVRQYTVSGGYTNGSGAIVNTCGINTTANASGNFSGARNHGSNCSSISATRPAYTCNTTTQGPVSLTSNVNTIAGNCTLNTYTVSGGFGANAAGATIDVCGINTTADASGNFSVTRNGGSDCSIISATKLNYTCSSLTGPSFLISNIVAGNTSCTANTQTYTCAAKPATGTVWNTVSSYLQTWNGSAWTPANSPTTYNATASTSSCRYACATNYTWNSGTSTCDASTQKITNCTGTLPINGNWFDQKFTQTWNGSAWTPTTLACSYGTSGEGKFRCNTNYTWNSGTSTCDANTQTYTCAAKPATGTVWNTVNSYLQTWNGSAWSPANSTTTYNTTASTSSCRYACASGYGWDGTSCGLTQNCSYTTTGWGTCSASCGGGTQSNYYHITTPAQYGGSCPVTEGQVAGTQACNTQTCTPLCSNWDVGGTGWRWCFRKVGSNSLAAYFCGAPANIGIFTSPITNWSTFFSPGSFCGSGGCMYAGSVTISNNSDTMFVVIGGYSWTASCIAH